MERYRQSRLALAAFLLAAATPAAGAAQLPCGPFTVHQFPADAIPRIDGDASDWREVGKDEAIGVDRLAADDGTGRRPDPKSLAGQVRVGWVKGLNRLYFLYEVTDDYWDFGESGLRNDIFELVVDGDASGGPLIARFHPELGKGVSNADAWFAFQNIHAQNYHIFTPPGDKDIAMAWGPQAGWIKQMPWSNFAFRHKLVPGGRGRLVMEFWITPFDHADPDGPDKSAQTPLAEGNMLGMAWAMIDRDGRDGKQNAFWNLSPRHTMYGQASELCAFKLAPLKDAPLEARWTYRIIDRAQRKVAFTDQTGGEVDITPLDLGDGSESTEEAPVHTYATPGKFVVALEVKGPRGRARLEKVWDVSFTGDPPK